MGSYWSSTFTMYFQIDYLNFFWYRKLISLVSLERTDSALSYGEVSEKTSSQEKKIGLRVVDPFGTLIFGSLVFGTLVQIKFYMNENSFRWYEQNNSSSINKFINKGSTLSSPFPQVIPWNIFYFWGFLLI